MNRPFGVVEEQNQPEDGKRRRPANPDQGGKAAGIPEYARRRRSFTMRRLYLLRFVGLRQPISKEDAHSLKKCCSPGTVDDAVIARQCQFHPLASA